MPMKIGDLRPSFEGATDWFNGMREEVEEFVTDSPTLVYFWATSCGICKKNMPQLREFKTKYPELKMVSVHMPRFEADTDLEKVRAAIKEHRLTDVCAVDNRHLLKRAFLNEQGWVPVYFLFDREGRLRSRAAGEYGIGVITGALEKMFAAREAAAV